MNLKKSKIFHEPYALPFFFAPERQSQRYSLKTIDPKATYRSVSELLQKEYDGVDLVFSKDMACCIDNKFDIFFRKWLQEFQAHFSHPQPQESGVLSL